MDRYNRGMPLEGRKNPLYHNGEFPDISNLDLSEIAALKRAAAEQVKDYQTKLNQQEQSKRDAKEAKLLEQIEELKKQIPNKEQQIQNNSLA